MKRSEYRAFTLFLSSYDRGYLESFSFKHGISLSRSIEILVDIAVSENLLQEEVPEAA